MGRRPDRVGGPLIEGEAAPRILAPGDYVLIPPHVRHRVEWTDADEPTVWLARARAAIELSGRPVAHGSGEGRA